MWGAGRGWHGMSRAGEGRAIRKACERGLPSAEPLHRLRFWGRQLSLGAGSFSWWRGLASSRLGPGGHLEQGWSLVWGTSWVS